MRKSNLFVSVIACVFGVSFILPGCVNKKEDNPSSVNKDSVMIESLYNIKKGEKPSPDDIIEMMKKGNERFISGKTAHPNSDAARIALANKESQGDFAIATILSCSDSRVPVEMLFDAGIMDLFVIRVAGNVADGDEIGTVEYGVNHVKTPVLVVMGHSKCGAVTAVTHAIEGEGHELEFNIPSLVDNIIPAAKKAIEAHHGATAEDIIPFAIEENVWQSISDILLRSAAVREKVKLGTLKIIGAIYNLENGKVNWLNEKKVDEIMVEVEKNPKKNIKVLADK